MFILKHNFASLISFSAVRESFSNVYPESEVPNKTTATQLVTKFPDAASVCLKEGGGHVL
jgi:hypothetical protein